jgi:AAHS family 3-hydroxyphenylpropionic acid transporter
MPDGQQNRDGKSRWPLILAVCCLASIGEGVDLQAPGVTMPLLGPLFKLSTGAGDGFWGSFLSQRGLFLSLSTFGMMVGAMIGGRMADRIGRKWVAVISVTLFAVLSALTAAATSADQLLWCRFLTGVGLGGATPSLIALLAETAPPNRRNTAIGCFYASMPIGGALVSLSSYLFLTPQHWPIIYGLGAFVPLLAVPGLCLGVPNVRPASTDLKAPAPAPAPALLDALFGGGRALRTSVLWLGFFFGMITMYILLGWLPSLLVEKGLTRPDAAIVQIGFNVLGAAGGVLTGMLIDRSGRRLTVALVFLSAIVCLMAMAGAPASLGISLVLGSLVGFTVTGAQTILYALAPACYPMEARGTGVGFAIAVGRIGSASGPLLASALLGVGVSSVGVLGVLTPAMAASGVAAVLVTAMSRRGSLRRVTPALAVP